MQVNREWWDGSTSKINDDNNGMVVEYITDSLYTKIIANTQKYIGQEWDKSACPWKINFNSDFFQMNWMLGWDTGYHETVKLAQSRLFKERQKGYTFYLATNGQQNFSGAFSKMFPCWMATLSRQDIDITDPYTLSWIEDKFKTLKPVINFDYSKVFAVPFLQRTGYGSRTLFSESLRSNWNAASYSGWGVAFYYHREQTAHSGEIDLGLDVVSLNNKFRVPDWDTTSCWQTEEFDNGLCPVSYSYSNSILYWRAQLGQRYQVDATGSSPGTLFDERYQAGADAAGAAQYYPNRLVWINGSDDPAIYQSNYIAGNLQQSQYRTFERTFNPALTFDQAKEYFGTQLAYLGFRFSLDGNNLSHDLNSEYFYIPEIDSVGVTTGNYFLANSSDAQLQQNYIWTDDVFELTPYDGTNDEEDEGDPNTYSDTTDWNNFAKSPALSFTDMYILTEADVMALSSKFYESLSVKPTAQLVSEFFTETYLTTEPTDVIVSLAYYNIKLEDKTEHSSTMQEIKLGSYDTQISAYELQRTSARYDYGEHLYYPHFGDFRDYAPYSTAILIIPYCGTVEIDPAEFMGHWVRVQMVIDYSTGTCTAYILKDELVINSISGQIGVEIPVTAIANQDLQRNLFNGYQNLKAAKMQSAQSVAQGAMSFLGSAMSSNPMGMAQSAMSAIFGAERSQIGIETAEYNLEHTRIPFRQIGSINPSTALNQEQQCRIIIFRPVMDPAYDPEVYGHVTGFATLDTALLSEYSGYTVCSNAVLDSVPCTVEEKQSIARQLQTGVYL